MKGIEWVHRVRSGFPVALVVVFLGLGGGWVSALSVDAWLAALPSDDPVAAAAQYDEFNRHTVEVAGDLATRLDQGKDPSSVYLALDGWTTHAARPQAPDPDRARLAAALLDALADCSSVEARRVLVSQLAKVAGREQVAPLGSMLEDPDMAAPAARALQTFAIPEYAREVRRAVRQALRVAEGPARSSSLQLLGDLAVPNAMKWVAEDLESDHAPHRDLALRAVARSGAPGAAELMGGDAAGPYFEVYARALAARGHPEAAARLCRDQIAGASSDYRICTALVTLHALVGDEAFDELTTAFESPMPAVRATAIELLAILDPAEVSPWLKRQLERSEDVHRLYALRLLARCEHPEAGALAVPFLDDEEAEVRHLAVDLLAAAGEVDLLLDRYPDVTRDDRSAIRMALLRQPGTDVVARAWKRAVSGEEAGRQVAMLEILADSGDREVAKDVLALAKSDDLAVAKQSIKILQRLAGPELAPAMVSILRQEALPDPVRTGLVSALVSALNEAPEPAARVAPIGTVLPETTGEVRGDLHRTLAGIESPGSVGLLAADANHPDAATRDSAVRALCKWEGMAAADPLLDIASQTPDLTLHAMALRRFIQLVQQYQADDLENEDKIAEARASYEAAMAIARREQEQARIREALASLDPEPEPESDRP